MVQWSRICLPIRGTWAPSLVQDDPTYHGSTKPVCCHKDPPEPKFKKKKNEIKITNLGFKKTNSAASYIEHTGGWAGCGWHALPSGRAEPMSPPPGVTYHSGRRLRDPGPWRAAPLGWRAGPVGHDPAAAAAGPDSDAPVPGPERRTPQ